MPSDGIRFKAKAQEEADLAGHAATDQDVAGDLHGENGQVGQEPPVEHPCGFFFKHLNNKQKTIYFIERRSRVVVVFVVPFKLIEMLGKKAIELLEREIS